MTIEDKVKYILEKLEHIKSLDTLNQCYKNGYEDAVNMLLATISQ